MCPISNLSRHLAAILFVDDTDILQIDLRENQSVQEAHDALQDSVHNWGQLLIASGGAFKPPKCFFHMISFDWSRAGKWTYAKNDTREELAIAVPMPDGSSVPIEHLSVDTAKETLGVFSCPSGKADAHIKSMQKRLRSGLTGPRRGSCADEMSGFCKIISSGQKWGMESVASLQHGMSWMTACAISGGRFCQLEA